MERQVHVKNCRRERNIANNQSVWNVDHPMQHPDVYAKYRKSCFQLKKYKWGKHTYYVQGYEPDALELLKSGDFKISFIKKRLSHKNVRAGF